MCCWVNFSSAGGPGCATSDGGSGSDGGSAEGKRQMKTGVIAGTEGGERGGYLIRQKERIKVGIRISDCVVGSRFKVL